MKFEKVLAIIPARKGSKRLPMKNKLMLYTGKELWKLAVETAKSAGIERVVVSTDDEEVLNDKTYADITTGVIMSRRSGRAATDTATMDDVIMDVLYDLSTVAKFAYYKTDTLCVLQPTSPLLDPVTLKHALHRFYDDGYGVLVAINPLYKPAGAFYIIRKNIFELEKTIWVTRSDIKSGVYMLKNREMLDIDYIWDVYIANALIRGEIIGED